MIHVIATIELKPGVRQSFLEIFNANRSHVLAEDGCLAYTPTVDLVSGIAAQGPVREKVVVVIEEWESLAHLKAHLAAPHMAAYRENVKDLVEKVSLAVLSGASEAGQAS